MIHNLIVDILPLAFFIVLFYKAKIQAPLTTFNNEYLSIDSTKYYKGIFAVAIVFHHLAQRATNGYIFHIFAGMGVILTAFFFFLSGYGLQKSYIVKQEKYRKGFLLKRLPPILIPYIIINVIYWVTYYIAYGYYYSFEYLVSIARTGLPLISVSWYIITILLFYVAYWLIMLICKKNYPLMMLLGILWWFLYVNICEKIQFAEWWYLSAHLLVVGMIWATYEEEILTVVKKIYVILTPAVWIIFIILFTRDWSNAPGIIVRNIPYFTALTFVIGVLLFNLKVKIGNKVLQILGEISLEIYLMQEIFIVLCWKEYFYHGNELLWAMTILAATIISAYILHKILQPILKGYKMLLLKRGIQ